MNLKYMTVSLFEITYKKNELFHDILINWDAPVSLLIRILWQFSSLPLGGARVF